ncbi:DUF4377 domain-containing protein [Alkanindiges sp. WGS2144]|uniref:DUF4377 domain-containing protein n=1 Tax=Alkanindiges sp. WGS2144 TaxID=3366808 RepID=UPI0037529740
MKKYLVLALSLSIVACSQSTPTRAPVSDTSSTAPQSTLNQQQLHAYSWQLTSATNASGQRIDALFKAPEPNKPITLNFEQNRIAIKNLFCNIRGLNTELQGNQLIVKQPIIATMMGCPADIEKMEKTLVDLLTSKPILHIAGSTEQPTLTLISPKQDKLVFKGVATPETKYGTQAQTIFLEVAPQTKTCSAGTHQMQCLQVREVQYNEQGVKTSTDTQWQNFYDPIEGYEHNNEHRVILRVKKYAVKNPPADASNVAYILDTVIEQEIIK